MYSGVVMWLAEPTVDALRAALRAVAPELAGATIVPRGLAPKDDPRWCAAARPVAAGDLAAALAGLHDPKVLAAAGPLPEPPAPASTDTLRARFGALIRPDQLRWVRIRCDWVDRVLAAPGRTVLVHGDFHGGNHLWDRESLRLRLVVDWETASAGEPEFDLRCLPGDGGIELFTATVAEYERRSGVALSVDRIMAWHLRTVLGDALWRAEVGVALPDGRTPAAWVDDLEARCTALGSFG
ncbi:phosphotransferase family protein [Dactylosporangium sp. NPDC051541]|uniref:phosphotransferase family protein n=1 Tax=Dactylosporangium sp. NPDC051541 TaxID=3363977 RepID=UPI00378E4B09